MGVMPWHRDRLTAEEIQQLWKGFRWRQREIRRALASGVNLLMAAWVGGDQVPERKEISDWMSALDPGEDDGS